MRLFDKGEANTFSDEGARYELIRKNLLFAFTPLLNEHSFEKATRESVCEFLEKKAASVATEVTSHLSWSNIPSVEDVFLNKSEFDLNQTFLKRKYIVFKIVEDLLELHGTDTPVVIDQDGVEKRLGVTCT